MRRTLVTRRVLVARKQKKRLAELINTWRTDTFITSFVSGCKPIKVDQMSIETRTEPSAEALAVANGPWKREYTIGARLAYDLALAIDAYADRIAAERVKPYCEAELAWEQAMMKAIGEDGIKSVSDKIAEIVAECDRLKETFCEIYRRIDRAKMRDQSIDGCRDDVKVTRWVWMHWQDIMSIMGEYRAALEEVKP